eukprot:Rmarinus@m.3132
MSTELDDEVIFHNPLKSKSNEFSESSNLFGPDVYDQIRQSFSRLEKAEESLREVVTRFAEPSAKLPPRDFHPSGSPMNLQKTIETYLLVHSPGFVLSDRFRQEGSFDLEIGKFELPSTDDLKVSGESNLSEIMTPDINETLQLTKRLDGVLSPLESENDAPRTEHTRELLRFSGPEKVEVHRLPPEDHPDVRKRTRLLKTVMMSKYYVMLGCGRRPKQCRKPRRTAPNSLHRHDRTSTTVSQAPSESDLGAEAKFAETDDTGHLNHGGSFYHHNLSNGLGNGHYIDTFGGLSPDDDIAEKVARALQGVQTEYPDSSFDHHSKQRDPLEKSLPKNLQKRKNCRKNLPHGDLYLSIH